VKDLAQARPGQDQQANGSDGVGIDPASPIFRLRCVLGLWTIFIDFVGQADRLGLGEGVPEDCELFRAQKDLALFLVVPFDAACRIAGKWLVLFLCRRPVPCT